MNRLAVFLATSGHSGVDRIMKNLLPELARLGLAVDLLRIHGHGPRFESVPAGVRVHTLPAAHVNSAWKPLCSYLQRARPDAILSDKDRVNRLVLLARRRTGVATRVAVRIGTTVSVNLSRRGWLRRRIELASIRRLYRWADRVIVPSEGAARDLTTIAAPLKDRVEVIPSPVVSDRMAALARFPSGHPWLDQGDRPVLLAVGELSGRKDFATLLRAFAEVRQRRDCRLVILGEGGQRDRLLQLAGRIGLEEAVSLPGFVHNPYAFMARAALLVSSSVCEGMPVVLVEAMALGVPVVATDCPSGPAEILQGGRLGALVPMKDPTAMAQAILQSLEHPIDSQHLQQAVAPYRIAESAQRYAAALGFNLIRRGLLG